MLYSCAARCRTRRPPGAASPAGPAHFRAVMGDCLPQVFDLRAKARFEALACPVGRTRFKATQAAARR